MNDDFADIFSSITSHTVTVRAADGHPLMEAKALHVAAVGVAGILLAPRLAAAAALAALLAGVTVSVQTAPEASPGDPA